MCYIIKLMRRFFLQSVPVPFFTIVIMVAVIPFGKADEPDKKSSSDINPVNYRSISSEDVKQRLDNHFESLLQSCEKSEASEEEKLSAFVTQLRLLKQEILNIKDQFQLALDDRTLLNSILSQIENLPYEEIVKESATAGKKASVMKGLFEQNYRRAYKNQGFAWWAQSIIKSLFCLSEDKVSREPVSQPKSAK